MLTGKSVHNQRIEKLWRDVFVDVLSHFYELFYFLEEQNLLDSFNEIHLSALHCVYLPLINEKLIIWRNAWARHRIRTAKYSPLKLWISGQMNNPVGIELTEEEMEYFGTEGFVEHAEDEDDRPILAGLPTVSEEIMRYLQNLRATPNVNFGIVNIFEELGALHT